MLTIEAPTRLLGALRRRAQALGVSIKEYEAVKARERQGTRTDIRTNIPETFPECSKGDARDKAGKRVGCSGKLVDGILSGYVQKPATSQGWFTKLAFQDLDMVPKLSIKTRT